MEIINLMEKEVRRVVNQLCDELETAENGPEFCTSRLCRLDVTCYVLNRIPPRYVTSGRGATHVEHEYITNPQLEIDILRLVNEGLRRVTSIQRYYYQEGDGAVGRRRGPAFNFPTITGRLLDAESFAPVSEIEVELRQGGAPAPMIDPRWLNPYRIDPTTAGCFSFWPQPAPAGDYDETRHFAFELAVETEGFEPFHHYFWIELEAEEGETSRQGSTQDFTLGELYLIPLDPHAQ